MLHIPTVGFETSAINKLEKDGSRAEALMAALRCGFHVRLPAMSADEILSDPDEGKQGLQDASDSSAASAFGPPTRFCAC